MCLLPLKGAIHNSTGDLVQKPTLTAQGSKPREFFIKQEVPDTGDMYWKVFGPGVWLETVKNPERHGFTHVIEYSAYEALELKLAEAEARVKELEIELQEHSEFLYASNEAELDGE